MIEAERLVDEQKRQGTSVNVYTKVAEAGESVFDKETNTLEDVRRKGNTEIAVKGTWGVEGLILNKIIVALLSICTCGATRRDVTVKIKYTEAVCTDHA